MSLGTLFLLFGIGLWSPGLESITTFDTVSLSVLPKEWNETIPLSAKGAIILDADSMGIVYQKNKDEPFAMASLTKMMTALIILENHDLKEVVHIPTLSEYIEGSTMHLKENDTLSLEDLLRGLMINSGNDSATVLAIYHSKTVFDFVKEMNIQAKKMMLHNIHFQNPHGLDAPDHFASAHNLAVLSKALLQYPSLRRIVNTKKITITSENGEEYNLLNTNELLDSSFPVYGLKTGTTDNAGECLILLSRINEKDYIIVILGSENRYLDAKTLLWHLMGKPEGEKEE